MSVETFWPAPAEDEQPLPDAGWEGLIGSTVTSGVLDVPGSTSLQPYRSPAGLFVRAGRAIIRGRLFELSGDDIQLAVEQNSGGQTRYDLVTLRLDHLVSDEVKLRVGTGTTGTNPLGERTVDGRFDVRLGVATVPSGSNVPSSVSDVRDFAGMDMVPCRTVDDIPSNRRRVGMLAYEATAGRLRQWNGASWRTFQYADESGGSFTPGYSGFSLGSGSVREGRYFPVSQNLWRIKGRIKTGAGAVFSEGILLGLPPGFVSSGEIPDMGTAMLIRPGQTPRMGWCYEATTAAVALRGESGPWINGNPVPFVAGMEFRYDLLVTRA